MDSHLILRRTPLGPLLLTASEAGLREVRFGLPDGQIPGGGDHGGGPHRAHAVLEAARDSLAGYFQGAPHPFDGLVLDLSHPTAFQRAVLDLLRDIPRGTVRSYGELAGELGRGSPRAVGQAVGANPLPIVIPCHRVVAAGGRLGGFSGGLPRKIRLLELEGVRVEGQDLRARIRG
jgi:methylated-DNA-[protein]-cysteine S-methyltransferase